MASSPCSVDTDGIKRRNTAKTITTWIPFIGPLIADNVSGLQPPKDNSERLGDLQGQLDGATATFRDNASKVATTNTQLITELLNNSKNYTEVLTYLVQNKLQGEISENLIHIIALSIIVTLIIFFGL